MSFYIKIWCDGDSPVGVLSADAPIAARMIEGLSATKLHYAKISGNYQSTSEVLAAITVSSDVLDYTGRTMESVEVTDLT